MAAPSSSVPSPLNWEAAPAKVALVQGAKGATERFRYQQVLDSQPTSPIGARAARSAFPSHVTQILSKLTQNGLVYKNRHGRYSFAVPLLGENR